jgi:hypothetical protein
MARYNPEIMMVDDGQEQPKRVFGPKNPAVSEEELARIMAEEDAKYDPRTGMPLDLLDSGIPEVIQSFTQPGFTPGPYPKAFEKFFGAADPNMIGYKIVTNEDGSQQLEVQTGPGSTITYGAPIKVGADGTVSQFEDDGVTGNGMGDGTGGGIYTASDGKKFNDPDTFAMYQANLDEKKANRKSAYDLLYSEFKQYGLDALITPLKSLIEDGASPSEFTIKLRETDAYKKRFAANAQRIAKGLRSLSEAEYIELEDQYQDVMRRYGLPENYYTRGDLGRQEGFEKFLSGDVSPVELEDRIQTAQKRVINSNPEVLASLKAFYPDITNSDILAYTLDPKNAIEQIKRKVTAAEIGGAAMQAGLQTGLPRAEELAAAGVTKDVAQQGFGTIAGGLQRGSQLASIYGENPYTQTTAEQEVFGLAGQTEARTKRQKIAGLEKATFSGQTGLTSGALVRDRAGAY